MGNIIDSLQGGSGSLYSDEDYFSCTDNAVPINGYAPPLINNHPATKAIYRQFYLKSAADVDICTLNSDCGYYAGSMVIFSGKATDGLDKLTFFWKNSCYSSSSCAPLAAGWYTVVIYGTGATYNQPFQNLYDYGYSGAAGYYTKFKITVNKINVSVVNRFSLSAANAYDSINATATGMQPLQNGTLYSAAKDTFGCGNTVLPPPSPSGYCITKPAKASYHEFVIGDANLDAKADSGVITIENYPTSSYSTILYQGDAHALATAQNAYAWGDTIRNLSPYTLCLPYSNCMPTKICATPGTYTLVSLTDSARTGGVIAPTIRFNIVSTKHYNGTTAQNMGSIIDSLNGQSGVVLSDKDTFSCSANAVVIDGFGPPSINGHVANKAIYRQFYLNAPADVDICTLGNSCGDYYGGTLVVFKGKASNGLDQLQFISDKNCFSTTACAPLDSGWYTVICYGNGPTYDQPQLYLNEDGYGSAVGQYNQFKITVTKACPGPQYNRPYKAAIDTITKQPFLLEWKPRQGSTDAYPIYDTVYKFPIEHFNCTVDTPMTVVDPCSKLLNRTVYYVFKTEKESYLQITTGGLWGEVFAGDVRFDSALFKTATPIQPCLQSGSGYIQLCSLQPGVYTLVLFAGDANVSNGCGTTTAPTIYIDDSRYSRFDHATKAYDFGIVPPDSAYHSGKVGDVNPLNAGRAASNDFFYCTTGSQTSDPTESACSVRYNPYVYRGTNNHLFDSAFLPSYPVRRNLWYTFVINQPGNVHVKVVNKTGDKKYRHPFAVYASDVDGTLPFSTVVSNGWVDSTKSSGLSLIDYNLKYSGSCSPGYDEISFYRDPCTTTGATRYYIVVDNDTYNAVNSQAEVAILLDTVNAIPTQFDHYFTANDMGKVSVNKYRGDQDNYSCATRDATDPSTTSCTKTLWYKFTSTVTGHVKYRLYVNGAVQSFSSNDLQLFKEMIPGDSTSKGLVYQPPSSYNDNDGRWGGNCVTTGTYYLLVTGCNKTTQFEFPEIKIEEEAGDFCSAPVVAALSGASMNTASAIVDCHTIGTDYGEFAAQLTCPPNANTAAYKSSWFRMDVGGKDTLDVTVYLNENTNANPDEIKYRMMTGDCGAMQEQSCVLDSRTRNTYRCLVPGKSYYIQVFTPVKQNNSSTLVTGSVDLILSSITHTDTCAPDANCLAVARFVPQFDCTQSDLVSFVNYSTYGSGIRYQWDFGYNNQTDTTVSPAFLYPALATEKTYNVKLSLLNKSCNGKDSFSVPVTIPGRPHADLGEDITACNGDTTITLHATSFAGATYAWQDGSRDSLFKVTAKGQSQYRVQVSYNGCTSKDTINVFLNNISRQPLQTAVLCTETDSVQLSVSSYAGVTYSWNTGQTGNSIYATAADAYWVDLQNNNCTVRDSFAVTQPGDTHPLGSDTTICFSSGDYLINATVNGADSYRWQDGSSSPQRTVSAPGTYWVDISLGTCTVRDSVVVAGGTTPSVTIISYPLCTGDSAMITVDNPFTHYQWSTGDTTQTIYVRQPGTYSISVTDTNNCRTYTQIPIYEVPKPVPHITGSHLLCNSDSVLLSVVEPYEWYAWSNGDSTQAIYVSSPGTVSVTVEGDMGCTGTDSVTVISGASPLTANLSALLCNGTAYTLPSGKEVSEAGVYVDTLRSAAGCDSLVTTVTLRLSEPQTASFSTVICEGSVYQLPSGKEVVAAGTYTDTLYSITGCDSLINTVAVSMISPIKTNLSAAFCKGSFYTLPNGSLVSEPGIYTDTVKSALGCDSLVQTTTLSVLSPVSNDLSAVVCTGKSYTLPSGKTVDLPGDYADTLHSYLGCDSLYTTVHLSLLVPTFTASEATVCSGEFYTLPSGKTVNATGTYTDTVRTIAGCDSLVTTVSLQVKETVFQSLSAALCAGEKYALPSGKEVNQTGVYADTVKSVFGCDSLISTVTIQVTETIRQQSAASICAGSSYTLPWGAIAFAAGTYSDTLRNANGCDSLVQSVTLSVLMPLAKTTAASICAGQQYLLPSGNPVSEAGTYLDTLKSSLGCDSVISTVTLSVTTTAALQNITAIVCDGQVYALPSGKTITGAGTYLDTLKSAGGCDSLISTVSLTVQPKTVVSLQPQTATICPGDSVLLSATGGQSYEWLPLITSQQPDIWVHPRVSTMYQVIITDRQCKDSLNATVTVYPQPVVGISKSNDISCLFPEATLTASGAFHYNWTPADSSITGANTHQPIVRPAITTVYHVHATTLEGCTADNKVEVKVIPGNEGNYNLATAFTPNGDGRNDCFGVKSWGMVSNLHLQVFDRTGRLLFETTDPSQCWDGTFKNTPMQSGTYVYQVSADTNCGFLYKKWTVVLIR